MKLGDFVEYYTGEMIFKQQTHGSKPKLVPELRYGFIWKRKTHGFLIRPAGLQTTVYVEASKIVPIKTQECEGAEVRFTTEGRIDMKKVPA